MKTYLKLAIVAAAVVVVAVIGYTVLPSPNGVGGPESTPVPTPTSTPAPAPTSTPSPTLGLNPEGPLPAGTYVATPFAQPGSDACFAPPQAECIDSTNDDSIRITYTVPDGWSGSGSDGVALADAQADGASLLFVRGASLYNDPCRNAGTPEIPVGPTVDDFADAIAAHPLLEVTAPIDVTLAGYSGRYLDLQVPADLTGCDIYRPWEPWYYAQGPGERWHLWVLDVGGVRVVVQSIDHEGTSAQDRAELQAIVDSVQIEP